MAVQGALPKPQPTGRPGSGPVPSFRLDRARRLDLSTPVCLGLGMLTVLTAAAVGGPFDAFLDIRSLAIVLGGTLFVTTAGFSVQDMVRAFKGMGVAFLAPEGPPRAVSANMVRLAETVRKEGAPILERTLHQFKDRPFLHKAMTMVVDGFPAADIECVLEDELRAISARQYRTVSVLRRASDVAPAMGLIGTMIGLIQMLRVLDDPAAIGPAMALALLTTLYGAILGHMVFAPLAARLEGHSRMTAQTNLVYTLTALALARNDGPRRLEHAINAHLAPQDQVRRFTSG